MSRERKTLDVVRVKLVLDKRLYSEVPLKNPGDVYEVMKQELAEYDREAFCILNMQADGRCASMNLVSIGGLTSALAEPREVFKSAILSNAHHIILVHNHPSGRVEPSMEDVQLTRRMVSCGELLGIPVYDHVIIGRKEDACYSFLEHGILNEKELEPVKEQAAEKVKKTR